MQNGEYKVSKYKARIIRHAGFHFHGETPVACFEFVTGNLNSWEIERLVYRLEKGEITSLDLPEVRP
jgi:hypothetical protein